MPLDPVPARSAGGILGLEYTAQGDLNQHTIHQHIAPFDPTPTPGGDFLYTHAPPKSTVSEAGIKETALALANLWAPYYPPTAQLILKELCYNSGGVMTSVPLPDAASIGIIVGTFTGAASPVRERTFQFWSAQNLGPDRLHLRQHPAGLVATQRSLSSTGGGFDQRDINLAAYLCSPDSGIVGRDGYPLRGAGTVGLWWSPSLVLGTAGGAGGRVIVSAVQPEGLQEDALWVDTSSGTPPYPLLAYSAALGAWLDVASGTLVPG